MKPCLPLVAIGVLVLSTSATAAPPTLDPESKTPYAWRVIVRFDPGPNLPPLYRERILREVRASLQPPDGDLWRAQVADLAKIPEEKRDPLCKAFVAKGWPALDSAEFRPLTGVKTHFLRVSVRSGTYHLEARQHDGCTGLASPVVRSAETRDADAVGRLAGMMLVRDFGPVGVIEKLPNEPDIVKVRFRGGDLPGIDRFVKPGDVFAVAAVVEQQRPRKPDAKGPGGFRKPADDAPPIRAGQPKAFVVLRVETPLLDGVCRCVLIAGSTSQPLAGGRGVVGFKCIKLGTTESPVAVRIVDANGGPPPGTGLLQIRATDVNFSIRSDPRDSLEFRDGVFRSQRPMRNVACVVIGFGTSREVRFPIPVFGDSPQTLRLALTEADAARAALENDCESLRARVAEVRRDQLTLLGALGRLIQEGKHREAFERVRSGLQIQAEADKELSAELDRLQKLPGANDPVPAAYLSAATDQLDTVRKGRPQIDAAAAQLKDAVKNLDDPVRFEREFRAKEINAQIRQLIEAGEVPDALSEFDKLYDLVKQEEIKERKERLEKEWKPKDAQHSQARDYVMGAWRGVATLAEFKAALVPLTEYAGVLTRNEDRLGLRNLIASFEGAYARLKTLTEALDPNAELDKPAIKDVQALAQALSKMESDARATVRKLEGGAPASEPAPDEKKEEKKEPKRPEEKKPQ